MGSLAQWLKCGDTDRFVRCWYECAARNVLDELGVPSKLKWHFMLDGGDFRKWYGNVVDVVNWENDGDEIRTNKNDEGRVRSRVQNERYYHRGDTLTWSALTSGPISVRTCIFNSLCGGAGYYIVPSDSDDRYRLLALLNSSVSQYLKFALSPTLNNEVGDLKRIPICRDDSMTPVISDLSEKSVFLSKTDWDSFETSWDFKRHPLV